MNEDWQVRLYLTEVDSRGNKIHHYGKKVIKRFTDFDEANAYFNKRIIIISDEPMKRKGENQ